MPHLRWNLAVRSTNASSLFKSLDELFDLPDLDVLLRLVRLWGAHGERWWSGPRRNKSVSFETCSALEASESPMVG